MRRGIILTVCTMLVMGIGVAFSKGNKDSSEYGWITKPFHRWTRSETVKLFSTDSPWVRVESFGSQTEGEHGNGVPDARTATQTEVVPGVLGLNVTNYVFTVRLLSAQPVREAYVRLLQLMNHYDTLPPARQKELDSKQAGFVHADVDDEVVITLAYTTNNPEASRNLRIFFATATTATLSQSAYLFTSRAGRLNLEKYLPPQGAFGARFIFPRSFHGEPIAGPQDDEFRFQVTIPQVDQDVLAEFKPSDMTYKGQFSY